MSGRRFSAAAPADARMRLDAPAGTSTVGAVRPTTESLECRKSARANSSRCSTSAMPWNRWCLTCWRSPMGLPRGRWLSALRSGGRGSGSQSPARSGHPQNVAAEISSKQPFPVCPVQTPRKQVGLGRLQVDLEVVPPAFDKVAGCSAARATESHDRHARHDHLPADQAEDDHQHEPKRNGGIQQRAHAEAPASQALTTRTSCRSGRITATGTAPALSRSILMANSAEALCRSRSRSAICARELSPRRAATSVWVQPFDLRQAESRIVPYASCNTTFESRRLRLIVRADLRASPAQYR